MELRIKDKMTIGELQKQFNIEFPYLKLEFFNMPHSGSQGLPKASIFPSNKILNSCRKLHKEGVIKINPDDTVERIENIFWNEYGLSAEVFRKSGNLWIETSLSNSWTLKRQNEEGRAFSDGKFKLKDKYEDITDRDKWE